MCHNRDSFNRLLNGAGKAPVLAISLAAVKPRIRRFPSSLMSAKTTGPIPTESSFQEHPNQGNMREAEDLVMRNAESAETNCH
jgi:hypothetical protein